MEFEIENLKEKKDIKEFIEQNNLKLVPEMVKKHYKEENQNITLEEILVDFAGRMEFSWEKAEGCRGISASMNIGELEDYFELMGRDDLKEIVSDDGTYDPYGAPSLINVCVALSIPVPKWLVEFAGISYEEHRALGHC
jgi:hypothetical protein